LFSTNARHTIGLARLFGHDSGDVNHKEAAAITLVFMNHYMAFVSVAATFGYSSSALSNQFCQGARPATSAYSACNCTGAGQRVLG
jgi:hypothetical protein